MNCRGCGSILSLTLIDLGVSPIANNLISNDQLQSNQSFYPLHVMTCQNCSLVQLSVSLAKEILFPSNYTYFSSFSSTWLQHSENYAYKMIKFLKMSKTDLVIEVASNDGYLLNFFKRSGLQVHGIEPAINVANVAMSQGIPTLVDYFGVNVAIELARIKKPKLIIGNNVLAHVPDLHDFIQGLSILVQDEGLITLEFPHVLNLINKCQFDTIYHEHYSYLSVTALNPIFEKYNLKVFQVEKLDTHGGSLRLFVGKIRSRWELNESVSQILSEEAKFDPRNLVISESFRSQTNKIKSELMAKLRKHKANGKRICAYGAAAKGSTLLNYCGVGRDIIDYVVDLNPIKQGKFLPGVLIPIVDLKMLSTNPPDVLLILPWNLSLEIKAQLASILNPEIEILRAIPKVEII